jgi:ribosomal-protein-serine acetyltransferase
VFALRFRNDAELRLLEERHAEALFTLTDQNRTALCTWLPWVDATQSLADTKDFLKGALRQFAASGALHAGIWVRGELAGTIGYVSIDWAHRTAQIGYWLAASFQGQGLMTQACAALVTHAFSDLGLNRVELRCAVGNTKSRAIADRLGFTEEGVLRQAEWLYDHFVDHAVYGLLACE